MEGLGASWAGELEPRTRSVRCCNPCVERLPGDFYPMWTWRWRRTATQLEGFEVLENPDLLPGQLLAIGPYSAIWGLAAWTKCPISCRHPPTCWRVTL